MDLDPVVDRLAPLVKLKAAECGVDIDGKTLREVTAAAIFGHGQLLDRVRKELEERSLLEKP